MKWLSLLLGCCLIQSLLASEIDSPTPDWITAPPPSTASACSDLSKGDLVAQKIALTKARAELGRMRRANVQSVQTIEKQVESGQSTKSNFIETTRVTSEEALETTEIKDQARIVINGNSNLCVLVGFVQRATHGQQNSSQ